MKKLIFLVLLMFSCAGLGSAQIAVPVKKGTTLPATCVTTDTQTLLFYKTGASNGLYYCSATNTWSKLAASSGYTVGPGSSTDNAIVRFDSTSGQLVQNSPVTIADTTGAIAGTQSIALSGSTSGALTVRPPPVAGTNTLTLPAGTTDFSATGGTSQVVQQATSGGALTVGQLAASNLSNGTTGSGSVVLATSPTLVTPALGTPASGVATNLTGLPLTTGVTGTLPVANGGTGVTSSTGTGNVVLSTSPTLVTPVLGTPSSGVATNLTGLPLTTGVTGTLPVANGGTGVTSSTGTGNVVLSTSPTLVTPALGTPSAAVLTNGTGLPITTGVSGLATGVATALATPSSSNIASAVTDETGSGALVFATSPTLVTPALGTPASGIATNLTGTASGLTAGTATHLAGGSGGTIPYQSAAGTTAMLANGSSGQVLQSNGTTTAPSWTTLSAGGNVSNTGTPTSGQAAEWTNATTVQGVAVTGTGSYVKATSPTLVTPALGTPSSVNLTNGTALPVSGITASTSTALGVGSVELGAASDTTLSRSAAGVLAVEGVVVPSISSTNTLSNKRITKRTGTTTSSATPTINTDNVDYYSITALSTAITSFTSSLSGTPAGGDLLWISITDNGTARAITWGASFEASTVALPTTTVISTRLDVLFAWNTVTSKWRCIAAA